MNHAGPAVFQSASTRPLPHMNLPRLVVSLITGIGRAVIFRVLEPRSYRLIATRHLSPKLRQQCYSLRIIP